MREPNSVLIYLLNGNSNASLNVMLLKRVAAYGMSDFWQGVTGGLESGESFEMTAFRELYEETGIELEWIHDVDFSYSFPIQDVWKHRYPAGSKYITEKVFAGIVDLNVNVRLSREHSEWAFFSCEKAFGYLEFDQSRQALKRCIDYYKHTGSLE